MIVEAVTNRAERFAPDSELYGGNRRFVVRRATEQRPATGGGRPARRRWIVTFEGVETRNDAEALRGLALMADPLEVGEDDGELWVHEVIGADVVDLDGSTLGRVVAVEANPASDLLVLEGGGLVPMVFVVERAPGRVVVDPPPGLLEL